VSGELTARASRRDGPPFHFPDWPLMRHDPVGRSRMIGAEREKDEVRHNSVGGILFDEQLHVVVSVPATRQFMLIVLHGGSRIVEDLMEVLFI